MLLKKIQGEWETLLRKSEDGETCQAAELCQKTEYSCEMQKRKQNLVSFPEK